MFFSAVARWMSASGSSKSADQRPHSLTAALLAAVLACGYLPLWGQQRSARIDVEKYVIDAELDPQEHLLRARALVEFVAVVDTQSVTFELNNNLTPTKITDAGGQLLSSQRFPRQGTLQVNFEEPLRADEQASILFEYDGRLVGADNQPVEGLKLAYVGEEVSYLLYPGRWFPVADYQADRFAAEINVTVPQGLRVVAPGRSGPTEIGPEGRHTFRFVYDRPAFSGSLAVVREQPQRVTGGGAQVDVYFRGPELAQAQTYGDAAGKILTFFSSKFGPTQDPTVSLVEIDEGSVNGYCAPGIIFLSPRAIGDQLNYRLLAHELAHQWWRGIVSPVSRTHLWLDEGLATYSELLYVEEFAGEAALEEAVRDVSISALTNDSVAVFRASRLEEFSLEYDAVVAKKGAMVLHMLRWVIGDAAFFQGLRQFATTYADKQASTDDLRQIFEQVSGADLTGFFIQWLEAPGTPEFKADYAVYRTSKGFRIVGQIKQDMDTFRMPVEVRIETDGDPVVRRIEVAGRSSDFIVETFGRPRTVTVDPDSRVLRYNDQIRLQVAIRKGEQWTDVGYYEEALKEYQKALEINKNNSLAHFRIAEVFFAQNNYQSAANAFREALNGDLEPLWTEVWSHINLGKIFDITGQRERAVNEYQQAQRTSDNTQGAQAEAERYLKERYRRERVAERY